MSLNPQCIQNSSSNQSLDSLIPIQHIETKPQNNSDQYDVYQNLIPSKILREFCNISEIVIEATDPLQEIQIFTITDGNKKNMGFSKHSKYLLEIKISEGDYL